MKAAEFIREKRREFDGLEKRLEKLGMECDQFELARPEWPLLEELRADLEQYERNYLLYEDFSNELQPLAEQEWVLFRSKTYLFDEFLQRWSEKLKEVKTEDSLICKTTLLPYTYYHHLLQYLSD